MISPNDCIQIHGALRALLDDETRLQPNRLGGAEIKQLPAGIVLVRPGAEGARAVVLLSQSYLDHRTSDVLTGAAIAGWQMALVLRGLEGRVPDAPEPSPRPTKMVPVELTGDDRREGLHLALQAAPSLRDTAAPVDPDTIVAAAEKFAAFIAGEVEVYDDETE